MLNNADPRRTRCLFICIYGRKSLLLKSTRRISAKAHSLSLWYVCMYACMCVCMCIRPNDPWYLIYAMQTVDMSELKDYIYFGSLESAPEDVVTRWRDVTSISNRGIASFYCYNSASIAFMLNNVL